jgi:CubicO group peptidase (beta-lactamase class C family)
MTLPGFDLVFLTLPSPHVMPAFFSRAGLARSLASLCFVLLFFFAAAPSNTARAQDAAAPLDSLARAFKAEHDVPGLIVATTGPGEQRVRTYGVASREDRTRLTREARFEIGSVTKVFTALLLAEAAERDAARLDDSLGAWLPDSVAAPAYTDSAGTRRPIRLRHLATHTAGLPKLPGNLGLRANPADPYADYGPQALHAFLGRHDLPRAPGAQYAYSNLGAGLLSHLLARRADTSYAALLERRILDPLGLRATYAPLPSDTASAGPRLAQGYAPSGEATSYWRFDALAGAGALRSTAGDMLRFLEAQMQPEATPLPAAIRRTHETRHAVSDALSMALGWHVLDRPGDAVEPVYWHNGGTGGFKSFVGFAPKAERGIVVLANRAVPTQAFNAFAFRLVRAQSRP